MVINSNRPDIGLYTRQVTIGGEYELVEQFIDFYCHSFKLNNKKTQLAVFVEPRLDSGFPDIVFAPYLPSIIDNWSDKREKLDVYDLKLLAHLYSVEGANGTKLMSTLGFPEKQILISLEKLLDAKLVSYRKSSWQVREIRNVFSLTKLIAVEAKISNINKVVEQTRLNTRFASHSYALTNSTHPKVDTLKTFKRFGLGLYGKDSQFRQIVAAKEHSLPSSYLSFQFNEWIGKSLAHQGGIQHA